MKFAIISDIHDNVPNLKLALSWLKKQRINTIVCCGDVAALDTLDYLSNNFNGAIHLVEGNAELYPEKELNNFSNIEYYGQLGRFKLDGHWFGVCHEPYLLEKLLEKGPCEAVFYGHTHRPWIQKKKSTDFINPGALTGDYGKGTFAVFDTENSKLQLMVLDKLD